MPNKNNATQRNTSFYRSRVGKKSKNEKNSLFTDKVKKRERQSLLRALVILFSVVIVVGGFIALGVWLQGLVDEEDIKNADTTSPTVSGTNSDEEFFATYTTEPAADPPFDITGIYDNYNGIYLDVSTIPNIESLDAFIESSKAAGINAVSIDIKKPDGGLPFYLNGDTYTTAGEYGRVPLGDMISLPDLISKFHAADMYVSGRISALRDTLAAQSLPKWTFTNPSTNMAWSDKNGDMWLNPYIDGARLHVVTYVVSAVSAGLDEVVLSDFTFPEYTGEAPAYADGGVSRYIAVREFLAEIRRALDDSYPKAKLGIFIPLADLENIPNEQTGLSPIELKEVTSFISTDFSPTKIASGSKIGDVTITNPAANPRETIQALAVKYKYLIDITRFRPIIARYDDVEMIAAEKQALRDSGVSVWEQSG
ncbi:hypothetical protein FACS1894219_12220 [Clostridia bacterium]|nr:hypothetical protein FACS1894219_12220 [Clostridia bacterium]